MPRQDLLGLEDGRDLEEMSSESLRESLRAALEMGESDRFRRDDGCFAERCESIPVALSVSPLREGATLGGAVAVLTDLQVIKNLEALVRRQERLGGAWPADGRSCARTAEPPSASSKPVARILQQKFGRTAGRKTVLCTDIIEEVDRLARVVTDFLSFARPSEPHLEPLDLGELIEITADRLERGGEMQVRIKRDLLDEIPAVDADPGQVEQVLLNLIRNGVESMNGLRGGCCAQRLFRGPGGRLDRSCRRGRRGWTRKRVVGFSIPSSLRKPKEPASAFPSVHRIMDSHSGAIEVVETSPGEGTVFRITFPKRETNALKPIQGEHTLT